MTEQLLKKIQDHEWIPLWDGVQPGEVDSPSQVASVAAYLVPGSRWCVVIYPGGGYFQLSTKDEGTDVARAYNGQGISAFVIRYRYEPYLGRAILADGQKGLLLARQWTRELQPETKAFAVLGFSAGGHLALTVCQHPESYMPDENITVHPDACILCYAVTTLCEGTFPTMPPIFLGDKVPLGQPEQFSYMAFPERMPPTYIWYSRPDHSVNYEKNSRECYNELIKHGIPAEIHDFKDGGHGIGLAALFRDSSRWFDQTVSFLNRI